MDGAVDTGEDGANARSRLFAPATQRERLLDGMARTVAEQGYAATSVADVLQVARISRRTFYERFADKEDCFIAAYDAIAEACHARVRGAFNAAPDWSDGIADGLDALLTALAAEPAFARLAVVEVLGAGPRGLARRDDTMQRFAAFIQEGRARFDDQLSPHPDVVAQAIVGGIYELLYSRIVRGEAERLPELSAELLHYTFMLLGMPQRSV
ncbi:TetR/AcrR family transcriptional regulator [Conexibacter sp. JD483]|uniref:TetR/AcrR family transcriptional regulator n=1 Tax=unclassified Conexibacter TaxID=2627773 RepID=UPI00271B6E16|nr:MULTISPECIES: TetR/AcrR family transcriptional regulator [unclassified Conexibacter]MDO8185130.1 TetR/AcrR family transcriptional regulator [Conexibacter sp. CPCC 205706]MDO8196840.1 TetR/AcrR family transcriptional regulator [Conexibacter sp. CPCC 205762]MDR9368616.1 TetR/AcrR family transcriptional regulator [Conexibacter sp. JD483]